MTSSSYPARPVIGVGAVVFHQNAVLLIKRGKPPKAGQWSLPGGRQELGETAQDAIVREVREETGLEVSNIRFLTIVDMIDRDAHGTIRYHYTLLDWMMEAQDSDLRPGSDAADAAWFQLGDIQELNLWSETLRIIHAAFEQRPG